MKLLKLLATLPIVLAANASSNESIVSKYGIDSPLATDVQKKIFSKLFDIELWSNSYPQKYDQDLTIRLRFATRVDESRAVEFLADEAEEIHDFSSAQYDKFALSLSESIDCDLAANVTLDLNYVPNQGIFSFCDGKASSKVLADGPLAYYLLDVFLHPETEYTNLTQSAQTN